MTDKLPDVDAGTFQKPLWELTETIAQKVYREGRGAMSNVPGYVSTDLFILLRYAKAIYGFQFYLHGDDLRKDPFWDPSFTFVAAPQIRSMIDILYNVTLILQNPAVNGVYFRRAGFKKELTDLQEAKDLYGTRPEWKEYLAKRESGLNFSIRSSNIDPDTLVTQEPWKTLGKYVGDRGPGGTQTPHQLFLKRLTLMNWREYSAMSHAGFEGLLDMAAFYTRDTQKAVSKELMDKNYPRIMSVHLGRTATLLIALLTEVQTVFKFEGAGIGPRIHKIWNALMPMMEAKELFSERYESLMASRGIKRK